MREFYLLRGFILIGIGFSLAIMGCSEEPQSEGYVNITDQFEVSLQQELSIEGGLPSLHIASIKPHECTNSYISHQTIVSPKKLQLFLHDILTEGECILGSEYVSEDILVDNVNPELSIEINLKNVIKNSGVLYSNEIAFNLELQKFDGLKISNTQLNRILPGMIWGSYSISDENVSQLLDDYLNDSDQIQSFVKGDYGHFYLAPDNSIVIYKNENEDNTTFLINNLEDFESFESIILEFKDLADGLVLQATNYDGNSLIIE
jgi:hypothetical protein